MTALQPVSSERRQTIVHWSSQSSRVERLVIAWTAASLLWCIPVFTFERWTPWYALLLVALPIGLVEWYALVASRDRAAVAAALFTGWAVVAALLSSATWLSMKGAVGRDYSVVIVASSLSLWAIGRRLPRRAIRLVGATVVAAVPVGVVVGTVQVLVGVDTGPFASFPGRAAGLATNPVYFGALMAGSTAYAAMSYAEDGARWAILAVGAATYGVMLSGSRVALLGSILAVAVIVVRAAPPRRSALVLAGTAGATLGYLISTFASGRSSIERLSVGTEGRIGAWRYGMAGLADRPLTGTGIGLFRDAVQGRFSIEFARDRTALGDQTWGDPHNLVVLVLVSTGVVGFALFALFAWWSLRGARGPMLALFLGIAVSWAMQPASIVTVPIAMLALGAAAPRRTDRPGGAALPPRYAAAPLVAGVLLASYVCATDLAFGYAIKSDSADAVEATHRLFLGDAGIEGVVAGWYQVRSEADPALLANAVEHAEHATRWDPTRPLRWVQLARLQMRAGELTMARDSLERAVELQPTEVAAWLALIELAPRLGDRALEAEASVRACELLPSC